MHGSACVQAGAAYEAALAEEGDPDLTAAEREAIQASPEFKEAADWWLGPGASSFSAPAALVAAVTTGGVRVHCRDATQELPRVQKAAEWLQGPE